MIFPTATRSLTISKIDEGRSNLADKQLKLCFEIHIHFRRVSVALAEIPVTTLHEKSLGLPDSALFWLRIMSVAGPWSTMRLSHKRCGFCGPVYPTSSAPPSSGEAKRLSESAKTGMNQGRAMDGSSGASINHLPPIHIDATPLMTAKTILTHGNAGREVTYMPWWSPFSNRSSNLIGLPSAPSASLSKVWGLAACRRPLQCIRATFPLALAPRTSNPSTDKQAF